LIVILNMEFFVYLEASRSRLPQNKFKKMNIKLRTELIAMAKEDQQILSDLAESGEQGGMLPLR